MTNEDIQPIPVAKLPIRLGQFLKLAGLVENGIEAKTLIQDGEVRLNGQIETRRGRQLTIDDVITFLGKNYRVIAASLASPHS